MAVVGGSKPGAFAVAGALALLGAAAVYGAARGCWAAARRCGMRWAWFIWRFRASLFFGCTDAETGAYAVLWLFLVVWATDIGAYAAGRLLGGPRLAPRLSPNKTWAGVAGGFVAAVVTGSVLGPALGISSRGLVGALSAFVSLAAQAGDLAESAIKRHFKVKDVSGLIPGHGGLFDRVDGLLAAAPAVALVELFSGGGVLSWR